LIQSPGTGVMQVAGVPNTIRKAGVYYLRRLIPLHLRPTLQRRELVCSLRTSEIGVARCRSRPLYLRSEELFGFVRSSPMLQEAVLAALVQDFYSTVLERENQMRLMELVLIDDDARHRKARYWKDLAQQARSELAANAFGSVSFISAAIIKKHGLALKLDDLELRQVNQAMLRASCDLAEALGARFEGDFNFEPRDKLLKHVLADAEVTAPTRPDDISPVQDEILFSVRAEEFRHLQLQRKVWEKQTALQARKTYQLFAEICGDRFLAGYVRSDSLQFRDTLIGCQQTMEKLRNIVAGLPRISQQRLLPWTWAGWHLARSKGTSPLCPRSGIRRRNAARFRRISFRGSNFRKERKRANSARCGLKTSSYSFSALRVPLEGSSLQARLYKLFGTRNSGSR